MSTCTEQKFLSDVAGHAMRVLHDGGAHRHLRFDNNGSALFHFNITTWPGYLAISGDVGCYVFARVPDMFDFFRQSRDGGLKINPSYWSEKCVASDADGIMRFEPDTFKARVREWLNQIHPEDEELRAAVERDIISWADEGEHEAVRAAINFTHSGFQVFQDFWEINCKEYTFRFLWCCYAIVWAIRQYDHRAEAQSAP